MKSIISIVSLSIALTGASAFAKGKAKPKQLSAIAKLCKVLAKTLDGETATVLEKGGSSESLLKQKFLQDGGDKEDFEFEANVTSIPETDGSGMGTASLEAAQMFVTTKLDGWADDDGTQLDEKVLAKKRTKAVALLQRLEEEGAEFGYDANGGGACGINYSSLLIIDKKSKTVHEFLVTSGPC